MNQKETVYLQSLCGSLLISSLNGIPAIAETMAAPDVQGEDRQTVVPSEGFKDGRPFLSRGRYGSRRTAS